MSFGLRSAFVLSLLVALSGCFDASDASSDELVAKGREHREAGELEEAQGCLDLAVEKDPGNVEAYRERAALWQSRENLQYALDNLDKVVELAPEDADGYRRKAAVLDLMGKPKQAKDAVDRAIDLDSESAEAYYLRGKLLTTTNQQLAIDNLDRAIALDGGHAAAKKLRAEITGEDDVEHDVHNDAASSSMTLLDHGKMLLAEGKIDEALECFDGAVASAPEDARPYMMRARIWYDRKNAENAIGNIDRVVVLEPANAEAHLLKSRIQLLRGKIEYAKHALDKAIELAPNMAAAYYERGRLLIDSNPAHAVNDLDKAIELDAKKAPYHLERGRALLAAGKTQAAAHSLDAAIELDSFLAEAFELRAQACEKLGDSAGAKRDRARLKELNAGK